MPNIFKQRIRQSLANPVLHSALDANAERRILARKKVFEDLSPDILSYRNRTHQMRAHTIEHLDQYIDQFIGKVQQNGIVVHRAATSQEAVATVLKIAHDNQVKLITKSKTMVGEEIGINQALETAGFRVIETDLGEYIVQLRGEPPSHIITPAVHLRRQEVGETFHEKLGVPYTDDIPTQVHVAQQTLREIFFQSDLGISGVNMGVAETGLLCIVTNEGNGRMVTTLPKIHIALMGMERIVPTLDDLALVLDLLPRSATGQKISVYTSLIQRPRKPDELDGAEERHLILIDNGRTHMRQSPLAEALPCIRCGSCLNACPVFREIGGHAYVSIHGKHTPYVGPFGSVVSPGLFGDLDYSHLARASSLCGACQEACPVNINLPELLLRVRAGKTRQGERQSPNQVPFALNLGLRIFAWVGSHPVFFHFAQKSAGIFTHLISPFQTWLRLPAFTGWGYSKDFPRMAIKPFHERWSSLRTQVISQPSSSDLPWRDLSMSSIGVEPIKSPQNVATQALDKEALIHKFSVEFSTVGGNFIRCPESELPGEIYNILEKKNVDTLYAWEEGLQPGQIPPGVLPDLQKLGVNISCQFTQECRAGLTGALAGVAATGSLLLSSGTGKPSGASLLPGIHIAILKATSITPELKQAFSHIKDNPPANYVVITGPSRTADIEMALTIGVHGPGEIYVICID
jgi:L-lactate dehydrogenase complex protein LldF